MNEPTKAKWTCEYCHRQAVVKEIPVNASKQDIERAIKINHAQLSEACAIVRGGTGLHFSYWYDRELR